MSVYQHTLLHTVCLIERHLGSACVSIHYLLPMCPHHTAHPLFLFAAACVTTRITEEAAPEGVPAAPVVGRAVHPVEGKKCSNRKHNRHQTTTHRWRRPWRWYAHRTRWRWWHPHGRHPHAHRWHHAHLLRHHPRRHPHWWGAHGWHHAYRWCHGHPRWWRQPIGGHPRRLPWNPPRRSHVRCHF